MEYWLQKFSPDTAVIVPTRSLANALSEQLAEDYLEQGVSVWENPNILLWSDYLKLLWQYNQEQVTEHVDAHSLISNQQSLLLWTQVIEKSRRDEQELTLLNVQQTAKAVQKSWRLMHDWQVGVEEFNNDHVADTQQFVKWLTAYRTLLKERGLMDESLLASCFLSIDYRHPFNKLIWCSYDLITNCQKSLNDIARGKGVLVRRNNECINFCTRVFRTLT